jgi:recombination protein RecA
MGRPKGSTNGSTKAVAVKEVKEKVEVIKNDKRDALNKILNEVNREAKSTILKFANEEEVPDRIPFGIPPLDEMTGGGIAHKRFSILWGPKSAGKTTLCYKAIAEAQKKGKLCAFIDLERTFDPVWATKMGVQLDNLVLGNQFQSAEEAMDFFIKLVKNKVIDFIVLDSIQALSPKGEQETKKGVEKSLEDDTMALLARKLSQFFRISSGRVYSGNVAILLVGQARTNLGGFIAFDQLSGGNALAHWSTMTMALRRGPKKDDPIEAQTIEEEQEDGTIKKKRKEVAIGFNSVIKLEKRKIASAVEGTEISLPFYFADGFLDK